MLRYLPFQVQLISNTSDMCPLISNNPDACALRQVCLLQLATVIIGQQFGMINKGPFLEQKCDHCSSYLLERIGSEYYCKVCQTMNRNYQEELRVVPAKYQSNSKNKRDLQKQRKLNTLLREFTDKYRDIGSPDEMRVYRDRLSAVKRLTPKKKGCRQAAAVVIYFGMLEQIKLNTKEFCKNNNLSLKIFNQKYKVYHQLFSSPTHHPKPQTPHVKMEEKIEESHTTEKSDDEQDVQNSQMSEQTGKNGLENVRHAIEVVFDDIFNKYYFKQKKQLIIDRLVLKLEAVNRKVLVLCKYYENPPVKLYYIIFALIKSLGHKINYFQYSDVVGKKTGYLLKRKAATEVKKIYENFSPGQTETEAKPHGEIDIKMEQNNSTSRKDSELSPPFPLHYFN